MLTGTSGVCDMTFEKFKFLTIVWYLIYALLQVMLYCSFMLPFYELSDFLLRNSQILSSYYPKYSFSLLPSWKLIIGVLCRQCLIWIIAWKILWFWLELNQKIGKTKQLIISLICITKISISVVGIKLTAVCEILIPGLDQQSTLLHFGLYSMSTSLFTFLPYYENKALEFFPICVLNWGQLAWKRKSKWVGTSASVLLY